MKKRVYLATVESNSTTERVTLVADLEKTEYGYRWNIVALLPDGVEIDTGLSSMPNETLEDAVQCVAAAWGSDVSDLQWLPFDEDLDWRNPFIINEGIEDLLNEVEI